MNVVLLAYTQVNPDTVSLPAPLRASLEQQEDGGGTSASPEHLVEFAGRVCYRSEDRMGRGKRFIAARVGEGHESIIEHLSFTFLVEGISRACSHQLVRHRLASYSQESQRYCEMQPEDELVMPPAVGPVFSSQRNGNPCRGNHECTELAPFPESAPSSQRSMGNQGPGHGDA